MVKVEITRSVPEGKIISYRSTGHANYDVHGKDIVCAGVSAVTFGTFNSIEALLKIVPKHMIDHGYLEVTIPGKMESKTSEQVQLLLESMVVMLNTIQESYDEFLTIEQTMQNSLD